MLEVLFWEDWIPVELELEVPVAKERGLQELYLMECVYEVLDPEEIVTFDASEPGKGESEVLL